MRNKAIAGYTYGKDAVARSPVSMEDLELLKKSVLFTEEDEKYLRMAGKVLADQVEEILDLWYGLWARTRIWCTTSLDLMASRTLRI